MTECFVEIPQAQSHALTEVDGAARATSEQPEQMVEILQYVINAK